MRPRLAIVLLALLLSTPALADYLKVQRPAIAREHASSSSAEVSRLTRGTLLDLVNTRQRAGYYHVTLDGGEQAWVYRTFVRRFAGSVPSEPSSSDEGAAATHTPVAGGGALDASAFASRTCDPEGTAQSEKLKALNRLKNRAIGPAPSAVTGAAIEDLLMPEDPSGPWADGKAIEVIGYVELVKKGGSETCNCGETADSLTDTHIELVRDESATEKSDLVVVEVTPTWRRFMWRTRGLDWSTTALKRDIKGKWVKVTGWMLFDRMHAHNAANAIKPSTQIWRGTAWEIHPITAIEVIPPPVQ